MLTFHNGTPSYKDLSPSLSASELPQGVTWIDILNGTPEETTFLERVLGRHIPTAEELNEIENSSRLRSTQGALCLSMPMVSRDENGAPFVSPLGFVLTRDLLVTVRFTTFSAFKSFLQDYTGAEEPHSALGAFAGLMDAMIDRAADRMEEVGAELDRLSQTIFSVSGKTERRLPARETDALRDILRRIGANGDLSSKIRDSLLGMARIVSYVGGITNDWITAEVRAHLETQRRDITSLADYEAHLTAKVQLLLDATMGLINIEQNNIIKVLTIVSVVGVPPTLVASMYGMNFKHMPELDWAWGYPYGLALIVTSAIAPLVWFRVRGWL